MGKCWLIPEILVLPSAGAGPVWKDPLEELFQGLWGSEMLLQRQHSEIPTLRHTGTIRTRPLLRSEPLAALLCPLPAPQRLRSQILGPALGSVSLCWLRQEIPGGQWGKCNFQAISAQAGSPQRCHSRGSEAGSDALQAPLNPLQAQGGWMVTLWPCLTPQPALQMQEGPWMCLQENSDAKVLPCLKLSPKHKASKINPGFSSAGFPWLAQTLSTDLFPS